MIDFHKIVNKMTSGGRWGSDVEADHVSMIRQDKRYIAKHDNWGRVGEQTVMPETIT